MLRVLVLLSVLLLFSSVYADESDSTEAVPDSTDVVADSNAVLPDTLSEAQKAYQLFLNRQQKRQDEIIEQIKERKPYLSIYDTLLIYFTSEKLNQRDAIERSFNRDAGDYFRHNQSYLVLDYQQTPMRKTVAPFGLSGNRTNIIHNGKVLTPFEHVVEPTGLIDYNDIPSALDDRVYLLPSGVGQVFGGEQSIATLLTVPARPDSTIPESYFKIDKGPYDYSHSRGKYSKLFSNGREVDFSIEYRSTSGIRSNTGDDAYLYTGRVLFPLGETNVLKVSGNAMRRDGSYVIGIDTTGNARAVSRFRTERGADIAWEMQNEAKTVKHQFAYTHAKQNSNLDLNYRGRFNYFSDGVRFERETVNGNRLFQFKSTYEHLRFTDGIDDFKRDIGRSALMLANIAGTGRAAFTVGTEYIKAYDFLPFASLLYLKESEKFLLLFSAGYAQRAPSLYELHLKPQERAIYSGVVDYADAGNDLLGVEKQMTASVTTRFGSDKNNIMFSVTGGKIKDGIDWIPTDTFLTLTQVRLFLPRNGDVTFTDFSLSNSISFLNYFTVSTGGAYHYSDYALMEHRAYAPDYQLFAGGELHYFWKQKWMDLYAYGELIYNGPYSGYSGEELGGTVVINTGLSFGIKDFRFHYIFQNSLQQSFENHEDLNIIGRYQYYGFTWKFFD